MELAEEARLERDAARTETDALQAQLATAQVRPHTGWGRCYAQQAQLATRGAVIPSYKVLLWCAVERCRLVCRKRRTSNYCVAAVMGNFSRRLCT
jgi:hypothetical protein